MYQGYTEATLWKRLVAIQTEESRETVRHLSTVMPRIEAVLKSGATAPLDFTLHDEGHSFRVAERMVEIIPADVFSYLTEYELGVLLLSAYLHDIGMTPDRRKVQQHYRFLLAQSENLLTATERAQLQEWLDDNSYGGASTLLTGIPPADQLPFVEAVVTKYARHRHNDWSEEWVRENISQEEWRGYFDWVDDVVRICRSHHEGYSELIGPDFDPHLANGITRERTVHLRYLACVLRVADILEFDPERTPDAVFRHRHVTKSSAVYWYKDHSVTRRLDPSLKHLLVAARPTNAQAHSAIKTMIADINAELSLCRRIAGEKKFSDFPGAIEDTKHRWDLPYAVHDDIRPRDDAYVFIDGAFRPDTHKLLQLLSGQHMYRTPFAAVRELLQNAFDAVKEIIALERLDTKRRVVRSDAQLLSDNHSVQLTLSREGDEVLLQCFDDGVGISQRILERHVLVSGAGQHHDVLELERKCIEAGFQLGRTGHFGVGVLSYFMLADKVRIVSRRHVRCGDADGFGWAFETDGVGSFGELRKEPSKHEGTDVTLVLKHSFTTNFDELAAALMNYLKHTVLWSPCKFIVSIGESVSEFGPGWTTGRNEVAQKFVDKAIEGVSLEMPEDLLPTAARTRHKEQLGHVRTVKEEVAKALKLKIVEGDLPDQLGHFRAFIPHFELGQAQSLGFLRYKEGASGSLSRIGKGLVYFPTGSVLIGWKGIWLAASVLTAGIATEPRGTYIEINWVADSAGTISVDRSAVVWSATAQRALSWLYSELRRVRREFADEFDDQTFGLLNHRLAASRLPSGVLKWVNTQPNGASHWREITFPATTSTVFAYSRYPNNLSHQSQPLSVIPALGEQKDVDHYAGISWTAPNLAPDRLCVLTTSLRQLVPVWYAAPTAAKLMDVLQCEFPPNWGNVIGARLVNYSGLNAPVVLWNISHPLVRYLKREYQNEVTRTMVKKEGSGSSGELVDPLLFESELLGNKELAAAFVGWCITEGHGRLWLGLAEKAPEFLKNIWRLLFGACDIELQYVSGENFMRAATASTWLVHDYRKKYGLRMIGKVLPLPPEEWVVKGPEPDLRYLLGDEL